MSVHDGEERVLITGGLGFLGGWLTRRLVSQGHRVTLLDAAAVGDSTAAGLGVHDHPNVDVVPGDITDPSTFDALDDDYDRVIHAAAVLGIQRVSRESIRTLEVNVRGTELCLAFAARQRALRRFLLFSSSEVYGKHARGAREEDPIELFTDSSRWTYAASKAVGEFFAFAYRAERDVPVSVVRPFNVYGPHRSFANAITTFVWRALRDDPIEVSGTGAQRRSWCHVTDFVDGALRCLTAPDAVGEVFNIGNAREQLSILELAELVVETTGSSSPVLLSGTDVPDVLDRAPDLDKASRVLGYRPVVGLVEGIRSVADALPRDRREPNRPPPPG